MMIKDLVKQYFPSLREEELISLIEENGRLESAPAGSVIMEIGKYIRSIPLLLKGTIKVLREDPDGNELLMYYLKPGETCAVSLTCCMRQDKSEIRAVAEEDVEMILLPVRFMDEWMSRFESWKNFVMNTYRIRFEELLQALDSVAFKKMDERLLKYLHNKAEANKTQLLNITHQEIASELNTSREVVSRLLKKLEQNDYIKLGRNRIELTAIV